MADGIDRKAEGSSLYSSYVGRSLTYVQSGWSFPLRKKSQCRFMISKALQALANSASGLLLVSLVNLSNNGNTNNNWPVEQMTLKGEYKHI